MPRPISTAETGDGRAACGVGEDCGQRPGSNGWADHGNDPRQNPQAHQPADAGSRDSACDGSRGRMCFGLSFLLDDGLSFGVAGDNPDLVVAESRLDEIINCSIRFAALVKHANYSKTVLLLT